MFGLSTLRLVIYAGAIALVLAAAGLATWRIDDLTAERDAARQEVGALRQSLATAVETNAENLAAVDRLRAWTAAADAVAADAQAAQRAADARYNDLKRSIRRAATPSDPPVAAPLRAALDGLRQRPAGSGGAHQDPGRAAGDPGVDPAMRR